MALSHTYHTSPLSSQLSAVKLWSSQLSALASCRQLSQLASWTAHR